jgi:REP element-mobilizing transposase RayT
VVVHCTLRAVEAACSLRRSAPYHAVRGALAAMRAHNHHFRITQLSLEPDHIHLLVEATTHDALAKGMQAFQSSTAQRLNRALGRRGPVFSDRYHTRFITSPTQARRALSYILNNWRHHKLDDGLESSQWDVDYYSSGPSFAHWKELSDPTFELDMPPKYKPLPIARPETWLLRKGFERGGPPISMYEVPGCATH